MEKFLENIRRDLSSIEQCHIYAMNVMLDLAQGVSERDMLLSILSAHGTELIPPSACRICDRPMAMTLWANQLCSECKDRR